jgi:hypothetical protein
MADRNNFAMYNDIFDKKIIHQNHGETQHPNPMRTEMLLVDSTSRNWDTEESNSYTVYLGQKIQNVKSIELVDGYIPNSGYIVTKYNNSIHFQETKEQLQTDTYITATIDSGSYDIDNLLGAISNALTSASNIGNKYACFVNALTYKVAIKTDNNAGYGVFNLIFTESKEVIGDRGTMETIVIDPLTNRKNVRMVEVSNSRNQYIKHSLGKLIGFKPINLKGNLEYVSQMIYRLNPFEYLSIFVNTENSDDFKNLLAPVPNNGVRGAFAMVQMNKDSKLFEISKYRHQVIDNARYMKIFNSPIDFSKIRVQFRTPDNNLYDFNGLENYLLFEIKRQ